jgi:hypothetical protein
MFTPKFDANPQKVWKCSNTQVTDSTTPTWHPQGIIKKLCLSNLNNFWPLPPVTQKIDILLSTTREFSIQGEGDGTHVQSSTNCGLGCFKNKINYFLCTNSHFLSALTTAQAVDPLPLYRDFPVHYNQTVLIRPLPPPLHVW